MKDKLRDEEIDGILMDPDIKKNFTVATRALMEYSYLTDRSFALSFFERHLAEFPYYVANKFTQEFFKLNTFEDQEKWLGKTVAYVYHKSKDSFREGVVNEQVSLLEEQEALNTKKKTNIFTGLSLVDTVILLLTLKMEAQAESLRTLFNISDKRYIWLQVEAYASSKQWSKIEELDKQGKIKISGVEPFGAKNMYRS